MTHLLMQWVFLWFSLKIVMTKLGNGLKDSLHCYTFIVSTYNPALSRLFALVISTDRKNKDSALKLIMLVVYDKL